MVDIILRTRKIAEGVIFKFTILSLILLILLIVFFSFTSANAEILQEKTQNITNDLELAGNFTNEGRDYKDGKFEKFGKFGSDGRWEYLLNNSTWVQDWGKKDKPQQVRYCSDFQREFVGGRGWTIEADHVPKTKWILTLNHTEIRFSSACSYYDVDTSLQLQSEKIYTEMTWWNNSKDFQMAIIINNSGADILKANYTVNLSIWGGNIFFKIVRDIQAGEYNDTAYSIYYDNKSNNISAAVVYNDSIELDWVNLSSFASGINVSIFHPKVVDNVFSKISRMNETLCQVGFDMDEGGGSNFTDLCRENNATKVGTWIWNGADGGFVGNSTENFTTGNSVFFANAAAMTNYAYTNFNITDEMNFTVVQWIRQSQHVGAADGLSVFGGKSSASKFLMPYISVPGGQIVLYCGGTNNIGTTQNYQDGKWHFVVIRVSSSTCTLRVDNSETVAVARGVFPNQDGWFIGAQGAENRASNISIDDFMIFNRTLSDDELTYIYFRRAYWNAGVNITLGAQESFATGIEISFIPPTEASNTYFNRNFIAINVSTSDINEANITFYLYNSSTQLNATTSTAGTRGINFTYLNSNMQYWFNVTVRDLVGNSNTTETRTITLDTTNPSISFISPTLANNSVVNQNFIFVNISANENLNSAILEWNGTTNTSMLGSGTTWYLNKTGLDYGIQTYKVYGTDLAGNVNVSETRTIRINALPTTTVNITPTSADTTQNLTCNNGTLSDVNNDNVTIISYDWYNGTWIGYNSSILTDNYTRHFQVWNCSITITDSFGNATYYSSNTVTILNTLPTAPTNMSPVSGYRDIDNSVLLECNGSTDIDNDILNYSYYGDTSSATTHLGNGTNYTWSGLMNGTTYYWRCRAWDGSNFSNYTSTISFRENRLPYASVHITPPSPSLGTELTCNVGSKYDFDGDSVSVSAYDWFGSSWLGLNSSTLASSYVTSNSAWKCSATITDSYENITINSSTVSVSSGCLANTSFKFEYTSTQNYTLLNFSSLSWIVYPDLRNVVTTNTAFFYANYTMIVNTTIDPNILIYIGGDTLNVSYSNTTTTPDINLSITQTNLTLLNPFYVFSLKTEDTTTEWNLSKTDNLKLKTYCANSQLSLIDIKSQNRSQIKLSLKELPELFMVEANTTFYRNFIPHSNFENISVYLIDTGLATPIYITFTLEDYTGLFNEATLRIKKQMVDSIAEITSDRFGIDDKIYTYLEEGGRYQIILEKGDNQRQIGWLIITSLDTTKTLQITAINISGTRIYQDVVFNFAGNYNSSTVSLQYEDKLSKTIDVGFFVYAENDSLLYEGHSAQANTAISYIVPDLNATYKLRAEILHANFNITEIGIIRLLNVSKRMIDLSLPDTFLGMSDNRWYSIISVFLIGFVSLIFGALHSGTGGLIVAGAASFFVLIGWLSVSHIIISIVILIAILAKLTERRVVV